MVDVPPYQELMNPVLRVLNVLGGSGSIQEIYEKIIEIENFDEQMLEISHLGGNQTEFEYRLAWARTYLKKFGSLENSERGVWALTKKAREEKDVDPQQVTRFVCEQSKITRSKHLEDVSNVDEGLTDLLKRVWEHKEKLAEGFTKKYGVHKLVWYEVHQEIEAAIVREKRLK
ncbi:MAG: hypothetical protein GY927_06015, partial [bacterium]|nr:hypothetical protein [bacterium]